MDTVTASDESGAAGAWSHSDSVARTRTDATATVVPRHILIAEDHPVSQVVIEKQVRSLGHRTDVVGDGRRALEALRHGTYDLLLTDCLMPGMDGLELARSLRSGSVAAAQRIPILALTASILADEVYSCYDAGIDDVLIKPVDREQLRVAIDRWLGPQALVPGQRPRRLERPRLADGAGHRTLPVLDWEMVAAVFGDTAVGARMLSFFLETTQPLVQSLEVRDGRSGDPAIRKEAHKLGGAARTAGARELAALCEAIERGCEGGDFDLVCLRMHALRGTFARLEIAVEDARRRSAAGAEDRSPTPASGAADAG